MITYRKNRAPSRNIRRQRISVRWPSRGTLTSALLRGVLCGMWLTTICPSADGQETLQAPVPPQLPHVALESEGAPPQFQLPLPIPAAVPSGDPAASTHSLAAIARHLEFMDQQEMQSVSAIEQNIERLREAIKKREQDAEEKARRAAESQRREEQAMQVAKEAKVLAESAQMREQQLLKLVEEFQQRDNQPPPPADDPPSESESENEQLQMPTVAMDGQAPVDIPDNVAVPRAVTNGAIDKRALADNLFGAGEYKLATQVYQELLGGNPEDHEAVWYRYQVATGYRHLENFERAATYYREVAAEEQHEFLAENAKWWLAALEQSTTTENRLSELTMLMEQIRNATQANK